MDKTRVGENQKGSTKAFDPFAKEQKLRAESESWDTTQVIDAKEGDIPVIDLTDYLRENDSHSLSHICAQLEKACSEVGFFLMTGHGIDKALLNSMFQAARQFHAQSAIDKERLRMDQVDWPVKGVGYLPFKNKKLPARENGNRNEAFLVKSELGLGLESNLWPSESALPGFRANVTQYAQAIGDLAQSLLPMFANALSTDSNFFEQAFSHPSYRLRMTHYPALLTKKNESDIDGFGIAPHVDTTFFTILAQDGSGLCIYSEKRKLWIRAPHLDNALIVNVGELLKQWSNDYFISAKHFANNMSESNSRYSIPFFFNANSNYIMSCIPSCTSADNPPKYPPISYAGSQAVAQGE